MNKLKQFFTDKAYRVPMIITSSVATVAIVAGVVVSVHMSKNNNIQTGSGNGFKDSISSVAGTEQDPMGPDTSIPGIVDTNSDTNSNASAAEGSSAVTGTVVSNAAGGNTVIGTSSKGQTANTSSRPSTTSDTPTVSRPSTSSRPSNTSKPATSSKPAASSKPSTSSKPTTSSGLTQSQVGDLIDQLTSGLPDFTGQTCEYCSRKIGDGLQNTCVLKPVGPNNYYACAYFDTTTETYKIYIDSQGYCYHSDGIGNYIKEKYNK